MEKRNQINIEVVYAKKAIQTIISLTVLEGTSVLEAVTQSGILEKFPEIELGSLGNRLGIFGERVALEAELKTGDRIEIYRDLLRDPKEARRARAAGTSNFVNP